MTHTRFPSIGFILSVVLVAAAGCGRSSPLSVPNGAVVGTEERPTALANSQDGGADAITAMTLHAGAAPLLLDAGAAPDVASASSDAADASPSSPPNQYRAIAISVGRLHNCAILDDHQVKCWGNNLEGELGLGDTKNRGTDSTTMGDALPSVDLGTGHTAKAIATGMYTSCATLDDDTLKCWGIYPPSGQAVGDAPGEMGDNLKPIDLGVGRKPVAVAIGWEETCVALDDGSFVCWGGPSTNVAAAADGARVVQFTRDMETLGVFDDGSVRKIFRDSPSGPTPIDFGGRQATFVAGASAPGYFDCVILRSGGTACTGSQYYPPVPVDAAVTAIAITGYGHVCGLDSAGAVTCWDMQSHPEWVDATNPGGTTSHVPLGQPAAFIGAGDYNACALLADGTVKCWVVDGGTYPPSLGASVATATGVSAVDLGTRPTP